jgi:O-antigen ligase
MPTSVHSPESRASFVRSNVPSQPSRNLYSVTRSLARSRADFRAQARLQIESAGERLALVRDPLRIAMLVLTILNVSRLHQHYGALGKFRPALLLVVASVGYAYLHPRLLTSANVLKLWPMRLIAILGVLACFSAAFGLSLGNSASFILDSYVKTLTYAFLVVLSIRHVRDLYTYVWAYAIACGILSYFSLFVFDLSRGTGSHVTRLNDLYTYDSNDVGVVMMVGMALTLLLLVVARGKQRWLLMMILLGIAATIARSGSRGSFLGLVAAGAGALVLVNSIAASRRIVLLGATLVALAAGAPPGYWQQMGTILQPKEDYNYSSLDGRKALMQRGLYYLGRYPVFGLGIDNFARAECTISPKLKTRDPNGRLRCTSPHNSYVQAAAELGISGMIAWFSLVIGGIFAPLRLRRRLPRAWMSGTDAQRFIYGATSFFPVAMIGFAVTSLFVSFAWMDTLYLLSALLAGLYVAARVEMEGGSAGGAGPDSRPGTSASPAGWRVERSARRGRAALRMQPRLG